jgi:hypothetical protein
VGLLISGNVMVDGAALEAPRNVVIEDGRLRRFLTPGGPGHVKSVCVQTQSQGIRDGQRPILLM